MVAPEVVLLTFLVARFFVVPAAQDVGELVKKTLGRVPAWRAGPKLSLETVLRDVASVNALSKSFPVQPTHRLRFSLTYRGYPGAMLRVLRFSRQLASLVGAVCVDCELVPHTRTPAVRRGEGGAEPSLSPPLDDDEFEQLRPCYTASLRQFYGFIKPSVEQLAVDARYDAPAHRAAAGAVGVELAATECCVCMDATLQEVTNCGHAFCSECFSRWRETSTACPLCRAPLPSRDTAAGQEHETFLLAEVALVEQLVLEARAAEAAQGAGAATLPAAQRLYQFVEALPVASARR